MDNTTAPIARNVADIRERISKAACRVGRDPSKITLVAAAKQNNSDAVRAAIAAGVDAVGENRVQEMLAKKQQGAYEGAPLHFIGHLQTNKVRQVVGQVELLQSLGSMRLANAVEKTAAELGIRQKVLLELNIGGESSKTGFDLVDLHKTLPEFLYMPHICVCGVMAIPPVGTEMQPSTYYFKQLRKIYVDIRTFLVDNMYMPSATGGEVTGKGLMEPILSMGMSQDFEEAIEAGATMIRVGSALFGHRA